MKVKLLTQTQIDLQCLCEILFPRQQTLQLLNVSIRFLWGVYVTGSLEVLTLIILPVEKTLGFIKEGSSLKAVTCSAQIKLLLFFTKVTCFPLHHHCTLLLSPMSCRRGESYHIMISLVYFYTIRHRL